MTARLPAYEILACPLCKGKLQLLRDGKGLLCRFDKLIFPIKAGVPIMRAAAAQRLDLEAFEALLKQLES